jgi:putative membrane protein
MAEAEPAQGQVPGKRRTYLAYERTVIASERTLLAWTRTAVSLVSFGFTIPKVFSYLEQSVHLHRLRSTGPLHLGMALIALGTVSLAAGMLQHAVLRRRIVSTVPGMPGSLWSPSMLTAVCMLAFGVFAFVHLLLGG